ncbi:MAG: hypothetical protein OXH07_09030 [Chloroflexi bacterium]|nr:hypothetical protein [Chloroflexota bacterium]
MRAGPGSVLAFMVVAVVTLTGCGGGVEPIPASPEVLEYANALVDAREEFETGMETFQEDSRDEIAQFWRAFERLVRLTASGLTSEDYARDIGRYARVFFGVGSTIVEAQVNLTESYRDALSRLTPPSPLSNLHEEMIDSLNDTIEGRNRLVEEMKSVDTDLKTVEDHRLFEERLPSVAEFVDDESFENYGEACRELRARLDRVLDRDVDICLDTIVPRM